MDFYLLGYVMSVGAVKRIWWRNVLSVEQMLARLLFEISDRWN
jgi:hypothetical protein